MNNKLFMGVVIAVLIAAVSAGGAFAGGVAYGKGQETVSTSILATPDLPSPGGTQAQFRGSEFSEDSIAELQARFQSGDVAPEDFEQLRRRFAGQTGEFSRGSGGFGGGGGLRFGGSGLSGTIESIEGNTITINTPQGPLQVTLSVETTITKIMEVDAIDLAVDTRIAVNGHRNESGVIEATSISITPEGLDIGGNGDFFGGFGGSGGFEGARDHNVPTSP